MARPHDRPEKPAILMGPNQTPPKSFDGPRNLLNAVRICVSSIKRKGCDDSLNDQINALAT